MSECRATDAEIDVPGRHDEHLSERREHQDRREIEQEPEAAIAGDVRPEPEDDRHDDRQGDERQAETADSKSVQPVAACDNCA